ncbi:hypothetical protein AXE80_13515 [Wenyingzhuangia fucanilytica]|uniref:Glycerophosphoryl diester phosphodiesterase membrane domain-containing protein n=1 Tax=Wenyingzhuangia fucanilytica TaxID=1790137 RepID=A0A1B1Y8Z7_9FLAO|nr:DUF975 family protein [Wenyingzhuangia fucanilytica]ANW97247.1 hypothetical protein AXE80_13515 [Wenyingzhuangia fucanilytica]
MTNIDILKKSFQDLKGFWSTALLASMPLSLLPVFIQYDKTIGMLLLLLLSGALRAGVSKVTLCIASKQPVKLNYIFDGFNYFKHSLGVFLLSMLFIALGLICFIVPGIIIAIWLSQSFFILVENPNLEPLEIFKLSKEMIKGNEIKLVYLFLIFVLISVVLILLNLVLLTLLIAPIQYVVFANFYNSLKK